MTKIALNYFSKTGPQSVNDANRPNLIGALEARGIDDIIVTRGPKKFDNTEGVVNDALQVKTGPDGIVTAKEIGTVALGDVSAVRSSGLLELSSVPVINDARTREFAAQKDHFAERIGLPMNAQPRTHILNGVASLEAIDDVLRSGGAIVKPVRGTLSEGISVVSDRASLRQDPELLEKLADNNAFLVQELIDMSHPLPSQIKGDSETSRAQLEQANRLGQPKEVRLYWFYSQTNPEATTWYPVVRLGGSDDKILKDDEYCTVDPDSIPAELVAMNRALVERFAQETGVAESFVTVDCTFGTIENDPNPDQDPRWWLVDFNGRSPMIVDPESSDRVSKVINSMYADQIIRLAEYGSNSV